MIICCDIDGVINNLVERTLEIYNERTNKNISVSDITSYSFYDCLPQDDADEIIKLFKEEPLWDSLSPANDSQWGLETLIKEGHKVYLATATDPINFPYKIKWLNKYFPFIDSDNIVRVMDKSILRCDIMIDDALHNLIGNVCERIIIDHPWNKSEEKDYVYDIYRANDFKDVINIIKKIERKQEEWN